MTEIRRMFLGGNTVDGFYALHDNMIGLNRNRLFILKGMPGGGKSSLMKKIAEYMTEEGFDIEYHHCPSDAESIDSILIKKLNIAIADGTYPHIIDPTYPGLTDKLIDLGRFIDSTKLMESKEEIMRAKKDNKIAYRKAFAYFKSAKTIYEEIVQNNRTGVDFSKVNYRTKQLIEDIFSKKAKYDGEEDFNERHMFSNANTPEGFVEYTETILKWIPTIYYIEGEIGTGKSTLIKRLIEESKIRGYSIEIYHNSTFPEKIETLIIKDINTCITSNKLGLDFPHNSINLNEYFNEDVKDNSDYETYDFLIEKAILSLKAARKNHEILEKCYKPAVDYDGVNEVREEILEEILTCAN